MSEIRARHSTGGEKGRKPVQFSRLPRFLEEVAEHFTKGAAKYPDVAPGRANWSLGYPWSWSFDALCRHLWAWWHGEDDDPETGSHHLAAVIFHALVLGEFQRDGLGEDDRPSHHRA